MKLSTSSSVLFAATLAMSSSSPSLAAPAGDAHDAGLSTSSSHHDMHHAHDNGPSHRPVARMESTDHLLGKVGELLKPVPILGGPLAGLLNQLAVGVPADEQAGDAATTQAQAEGMAAFEAAVGEISRILNGTISKLPGPVPGIVGIPLAKVAADPDAVPSTSASDTPAPSLSANPSAAAAADGQSTSASISSTLTPSPSETPAAAAAANDDPQATSSGSSASAAPSSPPMPPSGPPNTPIQPPVNVPLPLPINI